MDRVNFRKHLTQSDQSAAIRDLPSGPRFSDEIDGAQREMFLKSFPAWVTSPVVSRQGDVFQINFEVDRARGPELLQSLQDTLSQRLGLPVKLLWSLRSRDGEINRVLRQQLGPQEPYHFVWIPEKNWLKIMLADSDSLSAASVLTIERTLGVECKVVSHHRNLIGQDERGRSLLEKFLPDGFRWQVGRRNGDYVASFEKDPPSAEYLSALRAALARYITQPVIFERRFNAKAFFKEVRETLPRGTELYKLTL